MSVFFDNGEVVVEISSQDISLIIIGSQYIESAGLSTQQARDIAAALLRAAEEKESK